MGSGQRRRLGVPRPLRGRGARAPRPADGVAAREVRRRLRRHRLAGGAGRGGPAGRATSRRSLDGGGRFETPPRPRGLQRHRPARRADRSRRSARRRAAGAVRPPLPRAPRSCAASCSPSPAPAPTSPGRHPGGARRRRVGRQRPEGVELGGPVRGSGASSICRTDPDVPKHAGLTVFLLPMDRPGVEVRPIRQMSGGASFNEVFLNDVRVPDSLRLGDVGEGWKVALDDARFRAGIERRRPRRRAGRHRGTRCWRWPGGWTPTDDPVVRQRLAALYTPRSHPGAPRPAAVGAAERRRRARPGGLDRQAAVDAVDERGLRRRLASCSGPAHRRHGRVGHLRLDRSTCSARPATGSPAAPTRSSAPSSASGCSACRRSPASTGTSHTLESTR